MRGSELREGCDVSRGSVMKVVKGGNGWVQIPCVLWVDERE
jgi:hypothetical protein